MLPFEIQLKNGPPVYEQVLYAARKAVVSGQLQPGDPFPSVRAISRALKVNPNTIQKVIGLLRKDGYLEVRPGVGTVVAQPTYRDPQLKRQLLDQPVEELVLRARELGVDVKELQRAIKEHWEKLSP